LYSPNEQRYIAKKYRHKIFVANNTLNFTTVPAILEPKEDIKKALGIPFKKVVLFVGRVTKSKRLDDLLEASQFLDEGVGLVIVGGGLSSAQRERISQSRNIIYLGEIYEGDKVNRIFKMADVFCIPGKMGLGINQAYYWGLPAVTQDVRHSPEIMYLKNGQNGFIVERGNLRSLAQKLNYLVSSPEIQEKFGSAAKHEIELNGSIDKMCDGFLQALRFVDKDESAT
jgi:glycosyltransferase involved in cell wall biosynthesis